MCKTKKQNYDLSEEQLDLPNKICIKNPIKRYVIIQQLSSVPKITRKVIFDMMNFEISKGKYNTPPKDEKELFSLLIDFGKTLEVAALSPQELCEIYITGLQPKKTIKNTKKKKRKHRK